MEWLLAGAALVAWLVYRGPRNVGGEPPARPTNERSKPPAVKQPWVDPRVKPDPRFSHGSNQWERQKPSWWRSETENRTVSGTPARWAQPGELVRVGGISIDSGMFYLGGVLSPPKSKTIENCLVDPSCKVALSGNDTAGETMSYWPSYSHIQPVARRTYLQWLAGGRSDPSVGIGYVFLFFYGLERRLFVDGAKNEAGAIVAEVKRLLTIYGENNSFRGYAAKLIDAAALLKGPDIYRPTLSPDLRNGYEIPLAVRLYLGRKLNAQLPFDDKDALLWLLSLPDTSVRTAASRCFEELVELWQIRFSDRYPDGLKVRAPKRRLKLEYRAASGTFERILDLADNTGPLPDIAAISAPLEGLRDILNACTDELGGYSRMLGKNPNARGSIEAAFLLPKELLTSPSTIGTAVTRRLDAVFNGRSVVGIRVGRLLSELGIENADAKLPAGTCNQIGSFLDKLDIGFEPDRRYGSKNLHTNGHVLLFKAKGGASVDSDRAAYASARTMVDIAALAAGADGSIEASEYDTIRADLRRFPDLTAIERARLLAYSNTLLKDTPGQQSAMQRLRSLGAEERRIAVQSAMSAILADGRATPDEVKFLERLYKTLGFPIEDVYSALHRGAIVIDEPVTVMVEQRQPGAPIPQEPAAREEGLRFDAARLERIKSETSAVSELLAGIFVEEEYVSSVSAAPAESTSSNAKLLFPGLDAAHGELLAAMLDFGDMTRPDFEERARKLRLLPDGAIETINEWGFDTFDEPVIEGDDTIVVVVHLQAQLQATEAAE